MAPGRNCPPVNPVHAVSLSVEQQNPHTTRPLRSLSSQRERARVRVRVWKRTVCRFFFEKAVKKESPPLGKTPFFLSRGGRGPPEPALLFARRTQHAPACVVRACRNSGWKNEKNTPTQASLARASLFSAFFSSHDPNAKASDTNNTISHRPECGRTTR